MLLVNINHEMFAFDVFSVKDLTALLFQLLQNKLDGDPTRLAEMQNTSWNQTQLNFSHAS
jgi:hypothetical protein